jgi:putative ABC transport system permease protein
MLRNYFKIAWRSLMKNKKFSFINIFGLSTGFVCCMLIVSYLYDELGYDSWQKNSSRLYQVGTVFVTGGKEDRFPAEPAVMAENMKRDFPEIEETARMVVFSFFGEYKNLIQYRLPDGTPQSFYETKGCAADASFFQLFNYHFTEGNASSALSRPNSVAISEEMAKKIFGTAPALHKLLHITVNLNGAQDFVIDGVFRPESRPSHIDANFFISLYGGDLESRMKKDGSNMVFDNLYTTYLLLKPATNTKKLVAQFPAFVEKYAGKVLRESGFYRKQFLLPLREIHLHADMMEMTPSGSVTYLYILGSVAVFILLIACINFMNLSTARSSKRAAEVGMRKVLGASRNSLIRQFLGESLLMSLIAFLLAMILLILLKPLFESIAGKNLSLFSSTHIILPALFFLISVVTGILAGIYPAFYLSSFRPVNVLKGSFASSLASSSLRKTLVVLQFAISVLLIVSALIISGQMGFLRSVDMGFVRDHEIVIPLPSQLSRSIYPAFKLKLAGNAQVRAVGASAYYPGISNPSSDNFQREGAGIEAGPLIRLNHVDENFLQTLDIKVVAGRLFGPSFIISDIKKHIILNEVAVQRIGFPSPADAIGKKICNTYKGVTDTSEVVGVVSNFHFEDLHQPIQPYGFFLDSSTYYHYAIVRAAPGDMHILMRSLENLWHELDPGEPFDYSFLDLDIERNYVSDNQLSSLVNYFTVIAIIVSCMGLFGLATFSAEQRSKEISVRKVLGASVTSLVALLTKDFLKLVIIAIFIASPLAWVAMDKWLQGFTSRISISWSVFIFTTLFVLVIAFSTIGIQTIRAALTNPVKNLKNE